MPDTATVDYPTEVCRSCGAPVIWSFTTRAKDMPVDAVSVAGGNIALEPRGAGLKPLARVLTVAEQFGRTELRVNHFSTCPEARRWRRRG